MTTEYTILLSFLYLLFIAIAYAPKKCKVSPVEKKVDYFPEIDDQPYIKTETVFSEADKPAPVVETALPVETAIATEPAKNALINPVTDLTRLTIRELKRMASEAKIKRYNVMKKGELILALS